MSIRYLSGINVDSNTLVVDDANNRVGIGTASPTYTFDIVNTSSPTFRITRSGATDFRIGASILSSGALLGTYSNSPIQFLTNSTTQAVITEAGNVGIGTTSPAYKLDVNGVGSFSNGFSGPASETGYRLKFYDNGGIHNDVGIGLDGTAGGGEQMWFNALGGFYWGLGTGGTKMRLDSNGNVGIGTTSPSNKLEVVGGVTIGTSASSTVNLYLTRTNAGIAADANYFVSANNTPNQTWIEGGYYIGELSGVVTAPNSGYPYVETYAGQGSATSKNFGFINKTSGSFTSADLFITMSLLRTGRVTFNKYGAGTFTGTATQRLAVDASGNVIEIPIGSGPVDGNGTANYITKWSDTDTITNSQIFDNGTSVIVGGNSAPATTWTGVGKLAVVSDVYVGVNLTTANGTNGNDTVLALGKSRGTIASPAAVVNGETIGRLFYYGHDGTDYRYRASIESNVDGAVSSGVVPLNLKFSTGTSGANERMRITSAGNVGIGTTAPGGKLQIVDGSSGTTNDSSTTLYVENSGSSNSFYVLQTATVGGGKSFSVTNAGNVGIGTTSPAYKLDVSGTARVTSTLIGGGRISAATEYRLNDNSYSRVAILDGGGSFAGGYNFNINGGTPQHDSTGAVAAYYYNSGGYISLYTNSSQAAGTAASERLRITSAGNVGIGTTSPSFSLSVDRATTATAQFNVNNNMVASFRSSTVASNAWAGIKLMGDEGSGIWFSDEGGTYNHGYISQRYTGQLDFATGTDSTAAATVKMTILSGGNVGIGTTSPGAKLHVSGSSIIATATTIDPDSYANTVVAGNIADGSGWAALGIGGNAGTGDSWAIAHNGSGLYFGIQNGSAANTMASYMEVSPSRQITLPSLATAGFLKTNASGTLSVDATAYVSGSGTTNYVPKWTSGSVLGDSLMSSNATGIGIGISNPTNKLYVQGQDSNSLYDNIIAVFRGAGTGTTNYGEVYIQNDNYDALVLGSIGSNYSSSNWAGARYIYAATGDLMIKTTDANTNLRFYTAGAANERMRITASGNVGIGTTSPASYASMLAIQTTLSRGVTVFDTALSDASTIYGLGFGYANSSKDSAYFGFYKAGVGSNNNRLSLGLYDVDNVLNILGSGNVGIGNTSPSQKLHVTGNIRVTGAYYDSNNEAGTSGQVLSSTGSGTDWVTPATTTASSLYDLLPAARVAYDWTVQMTSGTWADIFSSNTVLSNGTWMVQVYVSDFASGGQQYQETYSGVMSWGNASSTNETGPEAMSEVVLHRSGHAANSGNFYLRTQERASSTLLLQGMVNYSHTSNTTINFKFVKVF